jgi:hypothetical protein
MRDELHTRVRKQLKRNRSGKSEHGKHRRMSRVRVASVPLWQAQLLKSALDNAEIEAEISGESRGALTGAIPIGAELPEVRVEEADVERARAVIREMNELQAQTGVRTCPKCAEENPANFASCWNCGTALESVALSSEKPVIPIASPPMTRTPWLFAILFATSTAILSVLFWQKERDVHWEEAKYGRWSPLDKDCQVLTKQGRKLAINCDFNRDGFFEIQKAFDSEERVTTSWRDVNANGVLEESQEFDTEGHPIAMMFDRDEDGRFEERLTLDDKGKPLARTVEIRKNGVESRVETLDTSGATLSVTITNTDGSWTFDEQGKRVWRGSSQRLPVEELRITIDGGVRKQRLTATGWVDEP